MLKNIKINTKKITTIFTVTFVALLIAVPLEVSAGTVMPDRFDRMSDSAPSATATHQVGFTPSDTINAVGSISLLFCSNSPTIVDSCSVPSGFDASGVTLDAQAGETGFSVHPNTTANRIVLTRVPSVPAGTPAQYDLGNIINPDVTGTLYIRVETFGSIDGTGTNVQEGGIAVSINEPITVNAEVPPTLTFCVAVTLTAFDCSSADNYFIDLGSLQTTTISHATSQFVAGTNAVAGYSVTISGTTLTSGLNTIPALVVPTAATTNTGQFGFNLRQNTTPNNGADVTGPGTATPTANYDIPDQFLFNNGDIIASSSVSTDLRKFTVNYITNIDAAQPGGVYSTTLVFICLANF